jgi:hypothetical protein
MKKINYLAANLPNELKVKILCGDGVFDTTTTLTVGNLYELGESRIKPIVRPLSDLTKPITQANYNEGEPFVPIVELAKLLFRNIKNEESVELIDNFLCYKKVRLMSFDFDSISLRAAQHLLMWHFDLITEDCEKVFTTSEFNPYA